MADEERRIKRIVVSEEFGEILFTNPNKMYVEGLPDDAQFVEARQSVERMCLYFIYESEEWDHVEEGEMIPTLDVEFCYVECLDCGNGQLLDEVNNTRYCPVCEHPHFK